MSLIFLKVRKNYKTGKPTIILKEKRHYGIIEIIEPNTNEVCNKDSNYFMQTINKMNLYRGQELQGFKINDIKNYRGLKFDEPIKYIQEELYCVDSCDNSSVIFERVINFDSNSLYDNDLNTKSGLLVYRKPKIGWLALINPETNTSFDICHPTINHIESTFEKGDEFEKDFEISNNSVDGQINTFWVGSSF